MSEEHLQGTKTVEHRLRGTDSYCLFSRADQYGIALASTMQVRLLMSEKPYDTDYKSLELGE